MVDEKIVEAFHLMWGNFPEPVMLVHKTREILAVNEACSKAGGQVGIKCSSIGSPERHQRCRANQALASQQAAYSKTEANGKNSNRVLDSCCRPAGYLRSFWGGNYD